jgi:hypothetical protein
MEEFFKVIRNDADMLALLLSQKEEFSFLSVRFEADIDLYQLVESNPIEGITLLDRNPREIKSQLLKQVNPEFECSHLQFSRPVSFINCTFTVKTNFQKVEFLSSINFRFSTFENELSLFEVISLKPCHFSFISKQSVIIFNSSFIITDSPHVGNIIEKNYHIENTTISSELNLNRSEIKGQLNLVNVKLTGSLKLKEAKIGSLNIHSSDYGNSIQDLELSETEFSGQVQLSNLNINGFTKAQSTLFNNSFFLTNVRFNKDAYFNHAIFHKSIYIEGVSALKKLSFYGSTFNSKINFIDFDFTNANISFTGANINADLWVGPLLHHPSITFNGTLDFHGVGISSASIVRVINLNNISSPSGNIIFKNAYIKGLLDIRNVFLKEISFDGTVVLGNIQDNNSLYKAIKDRNSARLLKHEAKKINNTISAISYNKVEMKLFAKLITIKKISDWTILRLNHISNNYGTNWLLGVVFTFFSGLLFYTLFTLRYNSLTFLWEDRSRFIFIDQTFWAGFINYFWLPTGFNQLLNQHEVIGGFCGSIFFILGKILIAYGIYQTIAAFRKYI